METTIVPGFLKTPAGRRGMLVRYMGVLFGLVLDQWRGWRFSAARRDSKEKEQPIRNATCSSPDV